MIRSCWMLAAHTYNIRKFREIRLTALTPNTHRALYVHEDPWLGTLELHHHDGAEVAALVAVRVVVAGEPAERRVRHLVRYFY